MRINDIMRSVREQRRGGSNCDRDKVKSRKKETTDDTKNRKRNSNTEKTKKTKRRANQIRR